MARTASVAASHRTGITAGRQAGVAHRHFLGDTLGNTLHHGNALFDRDTLGHGAVGRVRNLPGFAHRGSDRLGLRHALHAGDRNHVGNGLGFVGANLLAHRHALTDRLGLADRFTDLFAAGLGPSLELVFRTARSVAAQPGEQTGLLLDALGHTVFALDGLGPVVDVGHLLLDPLVFDLGRHDRDLDATGPRFHDTLGDHAVDRDGFGTGLGIRFTAIGRVRDLLTHLLIGDAFDLNGYLNIFDRLDLAGGDTARADQRVGSPAGSGMVAGLQAWGEHYCQATSYEHLTHGMPPQNRCNLARPRRLVLDQRLPMPDTELVCASTMRLIRAVRRKSLRAIRKN